MSANLPAASARFIGRRRNDPLVRTNRVFQKIPKIFRRDFSFGAAFGFAAAKAM